MNSVYYHSYCVVFWRAIAAIMCVWEEGGGCMCMCVCGCVCVCVCVYVCVWLYHCTYKITG